MNYIELIGDYATAYQDVLKNGGMFFPGNGQDSASVVVRGKTCITYWKEGSRRKKEVMELSQYLGTNPYAQTGGRLARYLISDVLQLPFQNTYWSRKCRKWATQGKHWHYQFVRPYEPFYGVEIDLKSAYFSSLFAAKSLLYQDGLGYLKDNNALENLKVITPVLPKWFRLQLLGCLASWRFSFLCKDKKDPSNPELVYKQQPKIHFRAAFNVAHRAILRNYKIMQKVHQIGGEYIYRMHTDSFFLGYECPQKKEEEIFNYLESKGVKHDIKSSGKGFFFDLNSGFMGRKFIGSKMDVAELMRVGGIKKQNTNYPPQVADRFGALIEQSSFKIEASEKELLPQNFEPIQLDLPI